jgi:hypothetical protein
LGQCFVAVWAFLSNSFPLFLRLPNPKTKNIAILTAEPNTADRLKDTLELSGLFNSKNIKVHSPQHPSDFKYADLFIVDWGSLAAPAQAPAPGGAALPSPLKDLLDQRKSSACPVLLFAKPGSIPVPVMEALGEHLNVSVTNFSARLVSDVLVQLIATQTRK